MTIDTLIDKPTILVVDDTPDNLTLMSTLLRDEFRVKVANSGEKALRVLEAAPLPDLVLLDVMMPGMSGYDVCIAIKASARTERVPVIFLTALDGPEDERIGLELGAADYITKPIKPAICLQRVRNHLQLKAAADFLHDRNAYLEEEVSRRTREVVAVQDATITMMASLAETRDSETGNHIRRTQLYVKALAEHLREHPRFAHYLSPRQIETLYKSAPLHDIGKIGIPDRILLNPGRLTPEEFEVMKTHTTIGRDAIASAQASLGVTAEFLVCAKEIAYGHQEKWDGSGYPQGLSGDEIPISARLMAVADVYDALISRRVYKEGMPHERAVQIIHDGRGAHFDPDMVDAFLAIATRFRAIAEQHRDSEADLAAQTAQLEAIAETIRI
ncbi:putative two-component system response regulator [Variovorax sp. OK605]|jgi:putative two-component system response regulator|uniref:HD-GYP domain-containing protein n=1 Tax=unclassified Variovorax TaxID=663243 RepID=UPI0008B0CE54|nr:MULTISPECIES: two-component system response regulator [unclassified Variovorax]SEK17292.1 putative two-component system response regulator [Variovorax sp. OK202]SFE78058.1 putative two-component system response regulator [Variovorax sp. OK212]SFQ75278.1 putative two-component system response regulator [Variovorax sp. OK605]